MREQKFKKGCVYKSLKNLQRTDPDYMGDDEDLFTKNKVYPCYKDGTLYSMDGTIRNEEIPEYLYDAFVLIGHCAVKKTCSEVRKEAMKIAYSECHKSKDFEKFYKRYGEMFDSLDKENDLVDDRHFTYLDGTEECFWTEYGSLNTSKV